MAKKKSAASADREEAKIRRKNELELRRKLVKEYPGSAKKNGR